MQSSTHDKVQGTGSEAKGKVKETVGEWIGNPTMQMEGKEEKLGGQLQQKVGDAKTVPENMTSGSTGDKASAAYNHTVGAAKETWGDMTGNTESKLKGKAQQTKGDVQEKLGDAKATIGK